MNLKSKFLAITATIAILFTACRKNLDTDHNEGVELNIIKDLPKVKKLTEINNQELKQLLPNTLWVANKILDSLAGNRFVENPILKIDSSHVYEIVKQGEPNSYFFNLIPTNIDNKKFMVQLISLRMYQDFNGQFINQLYIYSNSSTPEKVILFDQVGKIINEQENNDYISTQSFSLVSRSTYFYPGSIFSFPSSNFSGGFSSPHVVTAAPHHILLQFAISTGNWALAANLGYIMANTTPCNTTFCQQIFNPPPPALNRTISDISILNPINTYPYYIPPPSYTSFNDYYYPNGYFSTLKAEIETYYKKVWVSQGNFFITSNYVTDAEHIKKQTFITSFYEWLYNLNYQSNPLYNYLRDNSSATSKLFQFFADINLNGSNFVFINNGYADYSQDNSAKFINWFALKISVDYSLLQQYVNNQISNNQFVDYYKAAFDFEPTFSATQITWKNQHPQLYNNLLLNISQDYPTRKSIGYWAIDYLSQNPSVLFSTFEKQFLKIQEGIDGTYNANYWDNPNLTIPTQNLPSWDNFNSAYPKHDDPLYDTPIEVYTSIGGEVLNAYNSNPSSYQNTCALRISKALNYAGISINSGTDRYKGSDGKYYFVSCAALLKWMKKTFGTPSGSNYVTGSQGGVNGQHFPNLLAGKKGIYIMTPNYPGGCANGTGFCASGHADLIENSVCDGGCFFNATGGVHEIFIWELQ